MIVTYNKNTICSCHVTYAFQSEWVRVQLQSLKQEHFCISNINAGKLLQIGLTRLQILDQNIIDRNRQEIARIGFTNTVQRFNTRRTGGSRWVAYVKTKIHLAYVETSKDTSISRWNDEQCTLIKKQCF